MTTTENSRMTSDHDLLIELRTEVRGLREDLKKASDSTSRLVEDHEKRIRSLELLEDKNDTARKLIFGFVTFILIAFMGALTFFFIPKVAASGASNTTNASR